MRVIGIVGLGVMGGATGGHLIRAGYEVHGFDIDEKRQVAFAADGGRVHGSVPELAAEVDTVITWLPSAEALSETVTGLLTGGKTGLVLVEMGTLSLTAKREAHDRLAAAEMAMLDCPVSGTGHQAEDAALVVLGSGDADVFNDRLDVFAPLGSARYLGEFGNGSVMKYIANLLVSVHTVAAAEAHNLGAASGIDAALVQEVIAEGVASSRMWDIRGAMMAASAYEPPAGRLDILKKDAGLIAEHAAAVGTATPALNLALELFTDASAAGLGSLDAAAIKLYLEGLS
ncbi:MAG: NAD(P)-dependent oxidoreductase [Acidimicrobiia bacterium]